MTDALDYARPAARAALMDLFEHGFCLKETRAACVDVPSACPPNGLVDADWIQLVLRHDRTPLTDEEARMIGTPAGITWAEAAWDHWPYRVHCQRDVPNYYDYDAVPGGGVTT